MTQLQQTAPPAIHPDAPQPAICAEFLLPLDTRALRPGDRVTSPARTISELDLGNFSYLTSTGKPAAGDIPIGQRRAPKGLLLALAISLLQLDGDSVTLEAIDNVRFNHPPSAGDAIWIDGHVIDKNADELRCRWQMQSTGGVLASFESRVRLRARHQISPPPDRYDDGFVPIPL